MSRILLVEDDQFLRELYIDLLTGEQYEVDAAEDGEVAMAKLKAGAYDLVLLDIMLPKKDGMTILKELTDEDKKRLGQIVMLTNLGQEAIIKEALAIGAAGFLIKSALAPDQVITEVQGFLAATKG